MSETRPILLRGWRVLAFQKIMLPPRLPLASVCPSVLKATDVMTPHDA
ncbi:MAG: hypothetical protein QOD00_2524 [Blastocatellia bacterium]|jgi:hypothetical protein|nr:hypothetical protein [Blastocatellia bacterium]